MSGGTRDRSTRPNRNLFQISDYVNNIVSQVSFLAPSPPPPPHMVHGGTRSRGRTVATYIDLIGEKDGYKITLSSCLMWK